MSDQPSSFEIERELEARGYSPFAETETATVWKNVAGHSFDVLKDYDSCPEVIKQLQLNKIYSRPSIHPRDAQEVYKLVEPDFAY